MSSTIDLDEVIAGLSKTHLATLQRAAAISPFIKERTLGSDLEPWNENDNIMKYSKKQHNDENEKENNVNNNQSSTPTKEETKVKTPDSNKNKSCIAPIEPILPTMMTRLDNQTLNATLLLREVEKQRKKSIRKSLVDMQQRHLEETKRSAELEHNHFVEERNKRLERLRRTNQKIIEEAERKTKNNLELQKCELEELQNEAQRQLQLITFQGISKYQSKFSKKYETVANLLISIDKESILPCSQYNNQLHEQITMLDELIGKVSSNQYGPPELKVAEQLCTSLTDLEASILSALDNIVKQEQQKVAEHQAAEETKKLQEQNQQKQLELQKQQQEQQQQQLQLQQQQNEAAAANNQNQTTIPAATTPPAEQYTTDGTTISQVSPERFKFYHDLMMLYYQKFENVKTFQSDESLKQYRNACQRTVNTPINAISNVSGEFLLDKYNKICSFFAGQPQNTNFGQITINDHPLARDYCLLLMAKTFVGKAYLEISSKNSKIAFVIATVVVALWKALPEFGQIFLAHTFKQSPFLAPIYLPKQPEQSAEEYCTVLGYHYDKNGKLEEQEVYLKRQAGIARLYGAIMITNGRQADGPTHPYGIEHAWYWLVNFMMIEPMPCISANVLLEILEIIGAEMWMTYSKQFIKLLVYVQFNYMPRLNAIDQGGPKVRLEMLLDKYLREGQIVKPNGVLPAGFW